MFGPYRLQELIGRGGMGEIYRAYDTTRGRVVALKRLPAALAADPVFQARFRSEAALAARLHEPHVIPIHDFGEIDGQLYIDMRLVDGPDLATILDRGPLPPHRVVDIIIQVAAALAPDAGRRPACPTDPQQANLGDIRARWQEQAFDLSIRDLPDVRVCPIDPAHRGSLRRDLRRACRASAPAAR